MDDLAATYAKLINLDHVSPLNDIATAHTTQRVCVSVCDCMCVCVWIKGASQEQLETVYDLQGVDTQNPWSQDFTAVNLMSLLCTWCVWHGVCVRVCVCLRGKVKRRQADDVRDWQMSLWQACWCVWALIDEDSMWCSDRLRWRGISVTVT